jgi:hypothetical protein
VARDKPHVSVGGLLEAGQSGKKDDHAKRKHEETELIARGKQGMRACKKVCTRKATDGRNNSTHAWEEDLMSVGLGFW